MLDLNCSFINTVETTSFLCIEQKAAVKWCHKRKEVKLPS